jgi:allantoate deiminase
MDWELLTAEIMNRCMVLGRCTEEPGRITRTYLRPPVRMAHALLTGWMEHAGLQVRRDAVGNLIGRLHGTHSAAAVFAVGSHIDSVPDAGRYDGVLGVLLGIAAAQALAWSGTACARTLDVIAFSEEEGIRFRTPFLGSRAVCGSFAPELLTRTDTNGITLAQAIRDFGLDPAQIPAAAYPPGQLVGYLEAHIEQGPQLEALDLSLGVVPAIMGQSRRWLRYTGHAGHAGTLPMDQRRDALVAAAACVQLVEQVGRAIPGLRATTGSLNVLPNAINVVPGAVRLGLDVRHAQDEQRVAAVEQIWAGAEQIAHERGLALTLEGGNDQSATHCDPHLTELLSTTLQAHGQRPERIVSGAGHDAVVMANRCPVALLFLRSPGGISHHPDESVRPQDVDAALRVMVDFLQQVLQE